MNDMASAFKKAGYKPKSPSPPKEEEIKVIKFYLDESKTKLNSELISEKAENWAESFIQKDKNKNFVTSTQLRKFYGDVLSLEKKLKEGTDFEVILPFIKLLKSKASYSANPKNPKIPINLKDFIYLMVDNIEDEKDFKAFKTIFEAVVGYFYGKGER